MQGSSALHDLPTDVTIKLSDGEIKAHKLLLAAVSPVFKAMLYGDFKEAGSSEIKSDFDLKTMQMLLDAVFKGSCEMDSLDDIVPLIEAADYYQIEKKPLQQMCDEAILSQFETRNWIDVTLLSRCAKVMGERSIQRVVEMIMNSTKHNFTTLHNLPEQILYQLLQRNDLNCEEVEIFKYLWNQPFSTRPSPTTPGLFALVRYSLIPPQYLFTQVSRLEFVDKNQVHKAIEKICTSCVPLGDNGGGDECLRSFGQYPRMPNYSLKLQWSAATDTTSKAVSVTCKSNEYEYNIEYFQNEKSGILKYILESSTLKNGIYSFAVTYCRTFFNGELIALEINGSSNTYCTIPLSQYTIITIHNQDGCLFLKIIDGSSRCHSVKSTTSLTAFAPIKLKMINLITSLYDHASSYSFTIIPAHILKLRHRGR